LTPVGLHDVRAISSPLHRTAALHPRCHRVVGLAHGDDLARAIPIQAPQVCRLTPQQRTAGRSGGDHTDRNIAPSAHYACPAVTCVANTLLISAPRASSWVCQCMRGRSPTRGDRPRMPSGLSASGAHVRLRLRRRGASCRQMHRSTRANTSADRKTGRVGGHRGADLIHRPNGERVNRVSRERSEGHLSCLRRERLSDVHAKACRSHGVSRDGHAAIR
jgi:hypothetical protein